MLLGARFRLLAAQTLLHYPALWWASVHGRVPLHVSVTSGAGGVTMIAGPGGVGKSTMLSAGLQHGARSRPRTTSAHVTRARAYGLVEPLRIERGPAGRPRRTAAGRSRCREECRAWIRIVWWFSAVPRRARKPRSGPSSPAEAARALVAGTYMAGELRRFWPLAATLALATGIGPAHPDVSGDSHRARRAAALHRRAGRARLASADR